MGVVTLATPLITQLSSELQGRGSGNPTTLSHLGFQERKKPHEAQRAGGHVLPCGR